MPFGFRKSISLGGGARMTFSKSGVSTSIGGKGYRITSGPRGTHVTIGSGGIRYRQRIDGFLGPSTPVHPSPYSQPTGAPHSGTPIVTADASQLVELSSASTLEQLNNVSHQPTYAWMVIVGGLILSAIALQLHFIIAILLLCLTLYLASVVKTSDTCRRTFHLEYKLEPSAQQRWDMLGQSFSALARTQRLWRITTLDHTYDWKRNAGASSLLTRTLASVQRTTSTNIASNVTPYCLNIIGQQFFFFPDRVYVLQNGTYGAVEYACLMLGTGQTRFIEDQGVPQDAQVVGTTWRYVNKNGGPDRRFNNNREIPIAQYGVVELQSATGLNVLLHVSSLIAVDQFSSLFKSFQGYGAPQQQRHSQQQTPPRLNPQQSRPHQETPKQNRQRTSTNQEPPQSTSISCYQRLGLSASCTKEEASAKYRQLAMAYHPDRVSVKCQ
jgi:hypothetical protein